MTPTEYADKKMKLYRTGCCKVAPTTVGRAHTVCSHCGKDVSMEMVYIYDMHYRQHDMYCKHQEELKNGSSEGA